MEKLEFDRGIRSFTLENGAVLRFNPTDPNLYGRFEAAALRLQAALEAVKGDEPLEALTRADRQLKEILQGIFGPENDFDALLGGMSLLAVGENGRSLLENLLEALEPVLREGVESCVRALLAAGES